MANKKKNDEETAKLWKEILDEALKNNNKEQKYEKADSNRSSNQPDENLSTKQPTNHGENGKSHYGSTPRGYARITPMAFTGLTQDLYQAQAQGGEAENRGRNDSQFTSDKATQTNTEVESGSQGVESGSQGVESGSQGVESGSQRFLSASEEFKDLSPNQFSKELENEIKDVQKLEKNIQNKQNTLENKQNTLENKQNTLENEQKEIEHEKQIIDVSKANPLTLNQFYLTEFDKKLKEYNLKEKTMYPAARIMEENQILNLLKKIYTFSPNFKLNAEQKSIIKNIQKNQGNNKSL